MRRSSPSGEVWLPGSLGGAEEGEPLATPERGPEAQAHHFPTFATPVGLGFRFTGVLGLTRPFGSSWPVKWVILAKAFSADQGLEYACLQRLHVQS
jgi:hypothetical protein